jgi:hypothetical protein
MSLSLCVSCVPLTCFPGLLKLVAHLFHEFHALFVTRQSIGIVAHSLGRKQTLFYA